MSEQPAPPEAQAEKGKVTEVLDQKQTERKSKWDKLIKTSGMVSLAGLSATLSTWFFIPPEWASYAITKTAGRVASLVGLTGVIAGHIGKFMERPGRKNKQ